MRTKYLIFWMAGMTALLAGTAASAHHGRAAYGNEDVTLQATVTEFKFINPHVQIYFDVTSEAGELHTAISS